MSYSIARQTTWSHYGLYEVNNTRSETQQINIYKL